MFLLVLFMSWTGYGSITGCPSDNWTQCATRNNLNPATIPEGINGSLDIIWKVNDTVKRSNYTFNTTENSFISRLQISEDNNARYCCEAAINTNVLLTNSDCTTIGS